MPNRLARETSPYLLQHQDNPVDWYPWGEEAFERARSEDKPIFLSIGYSACHWCHVMAHESFEDEATAAVLNEQFVCIKVDREERPDVDSIYMSAVQAITGGGGWPMSMFLMPDGRPFFGGTYFPNTPRHGMPAFVQVLNRIAQLYAENQDGLAKDANNLTQAITHSISLIETPPDIPADDVFGAAFKAIASSFDAKYGGFSSQPKFPPSMTLELLLRLYLRYDWKQALMMVTHTLDRMAAGGMYDQLGGGFHRYSTDSRWLVPHFEKMLYDNALLIRVYLNAYLVTGDAHYRDIVEQTVEYVRREMTSPEGGFYSSQDADTEGHEGETFVWSADELRQSLADQPHLDAILDYWGVAKGPNFEGKNILWVPDGFEAVAVRHHIAVAEVKTGVQVAAKALFALRETRVKPGTDTKILAAWNGLMIDSLALAGRTLRRPDYTELAKNAAEFILGRMRNDGRLLRSYREGQARHAGYLEDYACLAEASISLYQTTFDIHWFDEAVSLCEQMIDLFWEDEAGFYDTARDHEALITRPQELSDNAIPSGTSVAVAVLLKLAILADRRDWRDKADRVLARVAPAMQGYPMAFSYLACQLDFRSSKPHEIVLAGALQSDELNQLLAVINGHYVPNSVVALSEPTGDQSGRITLLEDKKMIGGKATAYVCHDSLCRLPVTLPAELAAELGLAPE